MPRRVNLLPKTERVRTATNVPALALIAGCVLVIFALVLSYYLLNGTRNSLQEEYGRLSSEREALEEQVAALSEYKLLATERIDTEKVVTAVYAGRTLVSRVLSDLSRVIPENVWISGLNVSAGDPQTASGDKTAPAGAMVSGLGSLSMQGNTYSFPDVALLLVRLRLVDSLQTITLGSAGDPMGSVDPKRNIRGFSLTAGIVNTQSPNTQLPLSKVEVEGL